MNFMLVDIFFVDRLKCAESYVQRDGCDFDVTLPELFENCRREMQSGCWRRDCSGTIRKYRLVAFVIRRFVISRNVWRKWYVAEPFDSLVHVSLGGQANPAQTVFAA